MKTVKIKDKILLESLKDASDNIASAKALASTAGHMIKFHTNELFDIIRENVKETSGMVFSYVIERAEVKILYPEKKEK